MSVTNDLEYANCTEEHGVAEEHDDAEDAEDPEDAEDAEDPEEHCIFERLSTVLRRVTKLVAEDGGGAEGRHSCAVIRLHQIIRKDKPWRRKLAFAAAVAKPTTVGLSDKVLKAMGGDVVLLAVQYEIDDGGVQQRGDLLFWQPGTGSETGRLVAVQCKRLVGGYSVQHSAKRRLARAARSAEWHAGRIQSWLAHLCTHDASFARCVVLRDGARHVAAATLTEYGLNFVEPPL